MTNPWLHHSQAVDAPAGVHAQSLNFSVVVASNISQIRDACHVRAAGYRHHLPDLRANYAEPDAADAAGEAVVLVCYDKRTSAPVGTARVHVARGGSKMPIQACVTVPESMVQGGVAEITRLAIVAGADPLVRAALFKAAYLVCEADATRHALMCARSRALISIYRSLGAVPLHDDGRMIPLDHVGDIAHQVLALDLVTARRAWRAIEHPLYDFMFTVDHPDIDLSAAWAKTRPGDDSSSRGSVVRHARPHSPRSSGWVGSGTSPC